MDSKALIWLFMFVGSTIGGFIPTFWGDSFFGMWSIIFTTIGGAVGIYIGFKMSN